MIICSSKIKLAKKVTSILMSQALMFTLCKHTLCLKQISTAHVFELFKALILII